MYRGLVLFLGAFAPSVLSTEFDSGPSGSVQDVHGQFSHLHIASLDAVKSLLSSQIADLSALLVNISHINASVLSTDYLVSHSPLWDFSHYQDSNI
jgi:hypothetical protein